MALQRRFDLRLRPSINVEWTSNCPMGVLSNETKIRSATYGSKKTGSGRKEFYPDIEERLHAEKTVWCRTTGSGHNKRQCTVQLTIFADVEPRGKPFIILKGKGQRIPAKKPVNMTIMLWLNFKQRLVR